MYIIIPTHGHYEIRDGPTFIQSADTYREAWHELASLINSPTQAIVHSALANIFYIGYTPKKGHTLCLLSKSTKPPSPSPPP